MGDVDLVQIPQEHVRAAWVHVEEWVQAAARRGGNDSAEYFRAQAFEGRFQFWMVWAANRDRAMAVVLTSLVETLRGKIARVELLAGDRMNEWAYLIETLEIWARHNNCVGVELDGRPGFERKYPDYKRVRVALYKEI